MLAPSDPARRGPRQERRRATPPGGEHAQSAAVRAQAGPSAAPLPAASALRAGVVPAMLLAGCLLTALAAHHSSQARGGVLLAHLLAGGLGLLLPLAAAARVLRPSHSSARRTETAALCALVAAGIAVVELALLAWLVLASGLSAMA